MKVTWNCDSYARFLEPVFGIMPSLQDSLLRDFIAFKGFGTFPDVLGKDGPYTAPDAVVSSRLYHVHLLFTREERTRSRNRYNRTSDRALIYTQHATFQDIYSLLAIFPQNAHALAKDPKIMADLALHARAFQALDNP